MKLDVDKQYLGQLLLSQGYGTWLRYMFRLINGMPFITEPTHHKLFDEVQAIIDGTNTRININLPPRVGKTTVCGVWLVVYALTINPKAQIIYTSFNQDLLSGIAAQVASIMQHPAYKAMYGNRGDITETTEMVDPLDEYWRDWLLESTKNKQDKFTSRKIITSAGGVVLFNSIGSAITGFGAGVRNAKGFSGFIIIDDGDKPGDVFSETKRTKTHDYFSGTLLTRLNNSDTPIVNTQQRLHVEDLTGYLESVYGFKTFKFPLLGENGECLFGRQYTNERILELQKDSFAFSSQYQQSPTIRGGNLIKTEWFKRYDVLPAHFDSTFIVADTAFTEKKSADNSAFGLFGTVGKDLYMIDGYCKKVIFPDLCRDMVSFYESAKARFRENTVSAIHIENKGSGISLIQQLREKGLPVAELMPTVHDPYLKKDQVTDKYTRFMEIAADLESGYFHIPESAPWLLEFINECEAFTGGKQDAHDDYCFVANTKIKTIFGDKNIQDVKVGDRVITPFGIRRVEAVKAREADVIDNTDVGLCGTPDHKILSYSNGLIPLCKAAKKDCVRWSIRNLHIWKTRKALSLTEQNTAGWVERDVISYLIQQEQPTGNIRKDCTLQCGNTTTSKKFRKGMWFITKTIIHTTVALTIWSVYHASNISKCIIRAAKSLANGLSKWRIWNTFGNWHQNGTSPKQDVRGTGNMPNKKWQNCKQPKPVRTADANLSPAKLNAQEWCLTADGAQNATKSTGNDCTGNYKAEKSTVYNLTVSGGIYFANDILVSNCDVLIYALKIRRKGLQTDWTGLKNNFIRRF